MKEYKIKKGSTEPNEAFPATVANPVGFKQNAGDSAEGPIMSPFSVSSISGVVVTLDFYRCCMEAGTKVSKVFVKKDSGCA